MDCLFLQNNNALRISNDAAYCYAENKSKRFITALTDPNNNKRRTLFDNNGRDYVRSSNYDVNGAVINSIDARNNFLQVKDPEGRLTVYTYDKFNQLISESKSANAPLTEQRRYTYDPNGNLTSSINPAQEKTVYEYDRANHLIKASVFATKNSAQPIKVVNYTVNASNQLTGYSQVAGADTANLSADIQALGETYTYTNLGQVESVTVDFGAFVKNYSYTYYPNGLKKTYTNPEGITYTYYYNKNNQLMAVYIPNNGQITYGNFNWLMPQTLLLPGGQKITYKYNDFLQVQERYLKNNSGQSLAQALYQYDLENNITKIAANDGDYNFGYDNLYRLKTTDVPDANPANDETFDYDGVGNRTNHSTVNGQMTQAENLTYNAKNQLSQTDANTTFTYTANGHTKTKTQGGVVTEYIYNHEERLIAVKRAGNVIAEYAYNPKGQRIKKTVNGNTIYYCYNENGLAAEYDGAGNFIKEYQFHPQKGWMTDPLFMRTATGDLYYYYNDHLGTPQQMVDNTGQVVWQAQYSAFGGANITINTIENNLRFPGQYFDAETGLHQNYFRDYDPELGRYLEQDPIGLGGGLNEYSYANLNSVVFVDPEGLYADVKCSGNTVTINIPITYWGASATPSVTQSWNIAIQSMWSGQIGQYNVSTIVSSGFQNNIYVPAGDGRAWVMSDFLGNWPAKRPNWTAAHEAGHLMGLPDQYTDRGGAKPGYQDSIMGRLNKPVTERDIKDLIDIHCGCNK